LSSLRDDGGLAAILESIEKIKNYRVVLVGDAIIDEYQYVLPMGKPPKEHIIATRYQDNEVFAGGVFAAANHVASFCKEVHVITCLGDDQSYENLIRSSLKPNVTLHPLIRPSSPTTLKRRFVDPSSIRKLFEVYHMNDEPLTADLEKQLLSHIQNLCPTADVVISTDFGHGLIGPQAVESLVASSRFLAVNTQTNSANMGYNLVTRYSRADYVCIDGPEARLAVGDRVSSPGDIVYHLAGRLTECSKLIVTQGRHGCITFDRDQHVVHTIPAVAHKIVDTIGAGDAFLSVTSPLVAAGTSMHLVGFIGNVVGALQVETVGNRHSVDKVSLIKGVTGLLK
jgi:bifunctional ADP-heptose synthase (sugar kinase/adenylyltransferase)